MEMAQFGWLGWIIIGGLAGWVASMVMGTNERQGCIMDVILGIVGAVVGGSLLSLVGLGEGGFIWTFLTALLGAMIVIWIWRQVSART